MSFVVLDEYAIEESSYFPVLTFRDENGALMVPNAGLHWSLYKRDRLTGLLVIVNGRQNVAVASASSITLVLTGEDLAIDAGDERTRFILVEGTYDSALGSNLAYRGMIHFFIDDLFGV